MNRGNRKMNEQAIELLGVSAGERVLDIGFGGGARGRLDARARRARDRRRPSGRHGRGAGRALCRRHRGRAGSRCSRAASRRCPSPTAPADGALTVNTVYFWTELPGPLAEISRVLPPGGTLVIAIRDGAVMSNVDLAIFTIRTTRGDPGRGRRGRVRGPGGVTEREQVHFVVGVKPG